MDDKQDVLEIDQLNDEVPVNDLLRAFSQPPVRYTAYYLMEKEETTLDELSDVITGWVSADGDHIATRTERDAMKVALYHLHLPVLDSLGIVQFDHEAGVIEKADTTEALEAFIDWTRALDEDGFPNDTA